MSTAICDRSRLAQAYNMERNLKEPKKVQDKRTNEIISDCLHNRVILEKVMENFSNTGLLTLSLVNKLWNYEAKSLMRDRGSLCPSFKIWNVHPGRGVTQRPMCQDLGAFASDLRRMTVVPFSGMKIEQCDDTDHKCRNPSRTAALDPSYNVILDRLPWKQFSIDLDWFFEDHPKCPTILLAKRVLRDFSGVFEELSVSLDGRHEEFIQQFLQDISFPRLKTLNFGKECGQPSECDMKLIKALISRAPNLQELRTNLEVKFMAEVLEGSSAVAVPPKFYPLYLDGKLPEGFVNLLRLEKMALVTPYGDCSLERFNRIIPVLLEAYRTSLNYLRVEMVHLGPLMICGVSFPNVKTFQIDMSWDLDPSHPVMTFVKAFDFTRILPALTTVDITSFYGGNKKVPAEAFEQASKEPLPDRAANIKHLCLTDFFGEGSAPFLYELFPKIEKLSVKRATRVVSIRLIWEHWADLKELEVSIRGQDFSAPFMWINFDSVLCGIFPEEVEELREKDDEFLKSVNIVPVMPSIACFKELRTLKLIHEQVIVYKLKKDPTAFCSRVTGLVVFARCPNLSVTIQVNLPELEEALSHMKPYAAVVLERRKLSYFSN